MQHRRYPGGAARAVWLAVVDAPRSAGCNTPPAYRCSNQPAARIGTVESIQTANRAERAERGAARSAARSIGGGLGSLIGGGTGKTVATIVGAIGGGFVGNEIAARTRRLVWDIGVRYDDGSYGQRPADRSARACASATAYASRHRASSCSARR